MNPNDLINLIRAEADACLATSGQPNGEYTTPFYVAHIVLNSLASRLEAALKTENPDADRTTQATR